MRLWSHLSGLLLVVIVRTASAQAIAPATQPDASAASSPASQPATETKDPRLICASHMRQMMLAGLLYANSHNLSSAPDLASIFTELQEDTVLDPKLVLCPNDHTVKAPKNWSTMSKPDQIAWAVDHTSYTYTGSGFDAVQATLLHLDDQIILLTEKLHDHTNHGGGMNVGFADGRVEFIKKTDLPAAIARDAAARTRLNAK